jgi:eukaryotic-like serine/threonine-protein kinase
MQLAVESRLGPYKVQSLIGAGSMGEVYRARDTRLSRDVAIKIIQSGATDTSRRRRFEHEARAASALNHPNILTIHDAGHEGGISYIVTEYVDGKSLRKLFNERPLSIRKALDIGIQIAAGLAAAHDAGIVHRDLKPENIMVTRDGRVKILDFGLAKEVGDDVFSDSDRTFGNNDTLPGLLIGTTAYMSPEQAKGGRVNYYSDQFALGLILYEMLSGEQAFRRETGLQTLSAILTEDPPALNRGSESLRWLVKRCLHKEPDHRYATTAALLRDLEIVRSELTEGHDVSVIEDLPSVAPVAKPVRRFPWTPVIALAAATIGIAAGYVLARRAPGASSGFAQGRFVPFSAEAALEVMPAWSPNGRTVAYLAETDGTLQVFARSAGTTKAVQLTYGQQDCLFPFWSPDGARVYYISDPDGKSLWSVGATGGSAQLVVDNVAHASIAPDGKTLALIRPEPTGAFTLWSGSLADKRFRRIDRGPLASKAFPGSSFVRFAPDGKLGAWLSLGDGRSEFWIIPAGEGQPRPALGKLSVSPYAREFAWTPDSERIVFSDRSGLSINSHLFSAEISTGRVEQITNGAGSELSPSVGKNGRAIAFGSAAIDYDVVKIGLDGSVTDIIKTPVVEMSPSSASGQIAYVTDRTGAPEIWLRTPDDDSDRPVVTEHSFGEDRTFLLADTIFAPDGRRIAFRRAGGDDEAIWISTTAGDPPVRLAKEPGDAFQRGPTWSPDRNQLAYFSNRQGRYVLMRARVGGFEAPVVVAEDAGVWPRWSPQGDWIASIIPGKGLALISPDGKKRRTVGSGTWLLHGWNDDGSTLTGIKRSADRKLVVASIDVRSGLETPLGIAGSYPAGFTYAEATGTLPLRGFSFSADGRSFLTSMVRASGDIWLLERDR